MKTEYNGEPDNKTERIRSILYFMQFIEKNIIKKQVYNNFESNDGFAQFMAMHMK